MTVHDRHSAVSRPYGYAALLAIGVLATAIVRLSPLHLVLLVLIAALAAGIGVRSGRAAAQAQIAALEAQVAQQHAEICRLEDERSCWWNLSTAPDSRSRQPAASDPNHTPGD